MAEIGWTHNIVVLEKCKDSLQREFYIRMTRKFGWTKNVLTLQIENQTCEKTLLNQVNFDKTLPDEALNQAKLAVRDEYTFNFLELGDRYSKRQFERAVMAQVEPFLREMGGVFSFISSQFRLQVGEKEFFIDLLLYHRLVEYALRESSKPIGVSAYRMVSALPNELRGQLPAPEQVAMLLDDIV